MSAETLAEIAQELDLGASLLLGKGEDAAGGRAKQSILADAIEAVVAAVYLDGGLEPPRDSCSRCSSDRIREQADRPGRAATTRPGSRSSRPSGAIGLPRYQVRDEGPDHSKHFFAAVFLGDEEYGEGEGRSKKEAEQAAAWVAWERLQDEASSASARPGGPYRGGGCRSYLRSKSCDATSSVRSSARRSRRWRSTACARCAVTTTGRSSSTRLVGRKITAVERRGKYLLVRLDGDDVLVVHLGMSGQLLRAKTRARRRRSTRTS